MKYYKLVDRPTFSERKACGEWYLSGAIPEAYKAPNDLSTPFHILRLVRVETKLVTTLAEN